MSDASRGDQRRGTATPRAPSAGRIRTQADSGPTRVKGSAKANAAPRLGIVATRHPEIRKAGLHLLAFPDRGAATSKLVSTVVNALRVDARPRRRGQQICVAKRVGALLRAYCPKLPQDVAVRVRMLANEQLAPIVEQLRISIDAVYVPERMAALRLGVTVADLREMCREKETRRRLGWPRPIATRILFRTAALDPNEAGEFLASLPTQEPWPISSWPEGWRS
jgi:hypothetical protein